MQQVVLPSLWPRKKNTRGPASDGTGAEGSSLSTVGGTGWAGGEWDASGSGMEGVRERDGGEEARRELEEEKRARNGRGSDDDDNGGENAASGAFEEGLRMRRREYDMPGGMPGMMI